MWLWLRILLVMCLTSLTAFAAVAYFHLPSNGYTSFFIVGFPWAVTLLLIYFTPEPKPVYFKYKVKGAWRWSLFQLAIILYLTYRLRPGLSANQQLLAFAMILLVTYLATWFLSKSTDLFIRLLFWLRDILEVMRNRSRQKRRIVRGSATRPTTHISLPRR